MTAVYDLNFCPPTFDIAFFLVAAELFAKKNGKSSFVVLLVPSNNDTEKNKEYHSVVDDNSIQWRIENIALPLIGLYPACIGHSMLPKSSNVSRALKAKQVYPEFYDGKFAPYDFYREVIHTKNKFTGFRASAQAFRYLDSWKRTNTITGKIVTITLRKYGYDLARNSYIEEWVKFADYIRMEGFTPVFVPDTDTSFESDKRLDNFIVFRDPCWNLGLRMALYEESYLNFVPTGGPSALAHLNSKTKSICMKYSVPGTQSSRENLKEKGVRDGQRQFDFAEGYHALVWEEDTFENIREEFNRFLASQSEPQGYAT